MLCGCNVAVNMSERKIGDTVSKYRRIHYILFHTNSVGKGTNLSFLPDPTIG